MLWTPEAARFVEGMAGRCGLAVCGVEIGAMQRTNDERAVLPLTSRSG